MSDNGERLQPEFSPGERLAALEANYRAFIRSESAWQEQLDGRIHDLKDQITIQRQERRDEILALRREIQTSLVATDKAINKAGEAQERQNELTRQDAQRARESMEARIGALERGESQGEGMRVHSATTVTWIVAAAMVINMLIALFVSGVLK